ncbi:DNA-binding domain-containing protein [Rhizobium sp. BK251]|uniref:HvfC/BufC N-terminal domain-containing protein n=1 Tax=Rhizobium sp. BK251 TaxID=2512125 RepID=UPI001043FB19|nr:DNA-binding domain-containing protein [Rhizobium sp. BK251]TCL70348.1 hypothetical protein EV286_107218 [Rhizobium sp. BK251]
MSADIQTRFAAALADAGLPVPPGLAAWNGREPERRFGVYRNNVSTGLTGAIASRFPAAEQIVGKDFFAAMARAFVQLHPPRSPLLLSYGDNFADFVAGFEPARALAYLPDVIRLEAARGRAYHAADVEPLDPAELAKVGPGALAGLRLVPHPSLSILHSTHPVVTIWAMNAGELDVAPIDPWTGEDALVVRPHMLVEVHRLPPGGAAFLQALAKGATLAAAAEGAVLAAPEFDLSTNLAGLIQSGAFTTIRKEGDTDE